MRSTDLLQHCAAGISSHPLLEIELNCVGPKTDDLDENTLLQLGVSVFKIDFDSANTETDLRLPNDIKNTIDYLIIDCILSKKKDPVLYLKKCLQMVRNDGFAIINEVTQNYEIALFIDALQGIKFEENNSRVYDIYFDCKSLEDVFVKSNLQICSRLVSNFKFNIIKSFFYYFFLV